MKNNTKPISLRSNFAWTLFGDIYYGACQWAMISVIAKLSNTATVGVFTLGLAISAPVFMLSDLRLRTYQASDAKRIYSFGYYLGLRLTTSIVGIIIVAFICVFSGYRYEVTIVALAIAVAKAIESLGDIIYGLLQQQERMDWIAKSNIIKGTLSILSLGVVFLITKNLLITTIALGFSWALVVVFYDRHRARDALSSLLNENSNIETNHYSISKNEIRPRFDFAVFKELVWIVLPMGIAAYILSLSFNLPNYFIERKLGESALGIYAAITYLGIVGMRIENAIIQVIIPRMSKYNADAKHREFFRLFFKVTILSLVLGSMGVLAAVYLGDVILKLLYTQEYANYVNVLVLIMISVAIRCLNAPLYSNLIVTRNLRLLMVFDILYLISVFVACKMLIPTMNITGAALAVVISSLLRLIVYGISNWIYVFNKQRKTLIYFVDKPLSKWNSDAK